MATPATPATVARETLKRLAADGLPPLPEHYLRVYGEVAAEAGLAPAAAVTGEGAGMTDEACELLAQVLEQGVVPELPPDTPIAAEALALVGLARAARQPADLGPLTRRLRAFWYQLEIRRDDRRVLETGLQSLLRLLIDNIAELTAHDDWLMGQLSLVKDVIAEPMDLRLVRQAESTLKDVILRQGDIRKRLDEAQAMVKKMMNVFLGRMTEVALHTDQYQKKLGGYAERIRASADIGELNALVDDLLVDTQDIQTQIMRTREELVGAQRQAQAAGDRVRELEAELALISEKVREDQLTGLLNRRGLEAEFVREIARAERSGLPLCVVLLDIDNFKLLNDTYGHSAGDEALVHLTRVLKESLRQTDVISRFGGEEFVILLPDTPLDSAIELMVRTQRALTRRFFLHNNERLLITFSAGAVARLSGETGDEVIRRADKAMYLAKRTGKNKVVAGE